MVGKIYYQNLDPQLSQDIKNKLSIQDIGRLKKYSYNVKPIANGQTDFDIPIANYNKEEFIELIFNNGTKLLESSYSIELKVPNDVSQGYKIVLAEPVEYFEKQDFNLIFFSGTAIVTSEGGGNVNLPISANDISETPTKLFVTTSEKNQIVINKNDIASLSSRLTLVESKVNNINTSDEKVKMNVSDSDAGYLEDKIDNVTIKSEQGKLTATGLKGVTVPVDTINLLQGSTSNIQQQIDSLSSIVSVKHIVNTELDLPLDASIAGITTLVRQDSTQGNISTFYTSNGTSWEYVGKINSELVRNFTTEPIELVTETTGVLPKSKYEKQNSLETTFSGADSEITAVNAQDAIKEVKNYAKTNIETLTTSAHTHSNKAILDRIDTIEVNGYSHLTVDGVDYTSSSISQSVDSAKSYVDNKLLTHENTNATTTSKGHMQVGSGLSVVDGVVSLSPINDATTSSKGLVQVGSGITVVNGVISVNPTPDTTLTSKGIMQVGEGLNVTTGIVSVPDATSTSKGKVQIGTGLTITNGVVSTNPLPDATPTTKGLMQVGTGLSVSNGLVSVTPTYTNSFDIDTPYADLPFGETITPVSTNTAMENYRKMTALTNQLLGYTLDVNTSTVFRYTMQTVKVQGASYQKIDVFYNYPDDMNKAFEFYRVIDAGAFQDWSVNALEICEVGLPAYRALKGTLVTDVTTGIKYVKSTGTTSPADSFGWVAINAPKQFLSVGRGGTTQTISAINTAIVFNTAPNTNMDYNNADGTFFLEAGRQYRITVTGGFDFSVNTGLITLGMYDSNNQSANGSRAKWISTTHTLNEGQSSVLDFIHNTSVSGRYKIVATVLSGTATARIESTRLVIQEI